MRKTIILLAASLVALGIAGCSGEPNVTAEEEQIWKNPPPAKPPTAEQMKGNGPSFVGEPQSTPVGKTAPPPGGPPTGATGPGG